jgi:hypothetical protein
MTVGETNLIKPKQKVMDNKIIAIGYIGLQKCYLNITEEEAIERYCEIVGLTKEEFDKNVDISIYSIEFKDEFECNSIWE